MHVAILLTYLDMGEKGGVDMMETLQWHETEDLLVWHKELGDLEDDFDEQYSLREIIQLLGVNPDDGRFQIRRVNCLEGLRLHIRCNLSLLAWFMLEFELRGTLLRYKLELEGDMIVAMRCDDLICDTTHNHAHFGKSREHYFASAPGSLVMNPDSYKEEVVKPLVERRDSLFENFMGGLKSTRDPRGMTVGEVYTMYCSCVQHMQGRALDKETFVEELKSFYTLEVDLLAGDYKLELEHVEEMVEDDI